MPGYIANDTLFDMYTIDGKDEVFALDDIPRSEVGAPCPLVLSNEDMLLLAYYTAEPNHNWDGVPEIISPDLYKGAVAVLEFKNYWTYSFGYPNDEVLTGHPLADRGLENYGAFEVLNSSWVRSLERMNRVHPQHSESMFSRLRHFILTFHDSTFECIAKDYTISLEQGTIAEVHLRMSEKLFSS